MYYPFLHKIAKNKVAFAFIVCSAGISCGFITLLFFFNLPSTFATFAALAIISPLIAIVSGDSKRLLWAGLVICLPITVDICINYTEHVGGTPGYMISFFDIVLAVLYVLWIAESAHNNASKISFFPEISIPAFFLIICACLSIIPSEYPELSIFEIIEVIKMYLAFLYMANNIRTEADVKFIISIFILLLFFEGFLGFGQHRYDRPFFPTALGGPSWVDSRVKGTWVSYNDFAWYLTYFLPIAMSMMVSQIRSLYKLVCFVTLAVAAASLMWTNSRSAWISFGMSALFVGVFVFAKINAKRSLINTFLAIVLIFILTIPLSPRLYNKMYGRFAGHDGGSAKSRIPQFQVAFNMIKDNPLLGVGINNYSENMEKFDDTEEGLASITLHPVHNIFLHIVAEIGIFGLSIFIWILAAIFFKGVSYIMKNSGIMVYTVIGMLAGILAFLIHGLFDVASIGSKMFIFTWFFAGLIFAISRIQPEEQTH